jgi:putative heme transporter
MLAPDHVITEVTLPAIDVRALARRACVPALAVLAVGGVVVLAGGPIHAFAEAVRRGLDASPAWALVGIGFECISLAGYVALLSLVAGRTTPRIGARESAQITLAGAAATRLLPTAGAGGAALAMWALRRAGLRPAMAARTLLAFLVVLYSVFLAAIVVSGATLALGLVASRGPVALSALPALAAMLGIVLALTFASRRGAQPDTAIAGGGREHKRGARVRGVTQLMGHAVRDAFGLIRTGDLRLAGAAAYWLFDAAVLWSMLHAFGNPPALPIVLLAYLVGQVANTVPIPGSVSGGMAGVLIAFGAPALLALPAVLAYRAIAVWLPLPAAVAALPRLRTTIARWAREDAEIVASPGVHWPSSD